MKINKKNRDFGIDKNTSQGTSWLLKSAMLSYKPDKTCLVNYLIQDVFFCLAPFFELSPEGVLVSFFELLFDGVLAAAFFCWLFSLFSHLKERNNYLEITGLLTAF